MRQRLPNRRLLETHLLQVPGRNISFELGIGFASGRPREIFLSGAKAGSEMAAVMADAAVAISVALQHGVRASEMAKSIAREPEELDGPSTAPASIIGVTLDLLAELEKGTSK